MTPKEPKYTGFWSSQPLEAQYGLKQFLQAYPNALINLGILLGCIVGIVDTLAAAVCWFGPSDNLAWYAAILAIAFNLLSVHFLFRPLYDLRALRDGKIVFDLRQVMEPAENPAGDLEGASY
jgi:hypothetical protein